MLGCLHEAQFRPKQESLQLVQDCGEDDHCQVRELRDNRDSAWFSPEYSSLRAAAVSWQHHVVQGTEQHNRRSVRLV